MNTQPLAIKDIEDRVLLLNINVTYREYMEEEEVLKVACRAWRVSEKTRNDAEYALAVYKNDVKGVFEIISWHEDEVEKGKWAFIGKVVTLQPIRDKYMVTLEAEWRQNPEASFRSVHC